VIFRTLPDFRDEAPRTQLDATRYGFPPFFLALFSIVATEFLRASLETFFPLTVWGLSLLRVGGAGVRSNR